MSKKIFIALGILAIASFSSCRKNRTCNCITSITTNGETSSQPNDNIIPDVNKEEGEIECAKLESSTTYAGFTEEITCTLNP